MSFLERVFSGARRAGGGRLLASDQGARIEAARPLLAEARRLTAAEVKDALQHVADIYTASDRHASDISTLMKEFSDRGDHGQARLEAKLRDQGETIDSFKKRVSEQVQSHAAMARHAITATEKITSLMNDLDQIAIDVGLLSINVRIEAARIGARAVFEALASHTDDLNAKIGVAKREIRTIATSLRDVMGEIASGLRSTEADVEVQAQGVVATMDDAMNAYGQLKDTTLEAIRKSSERAIALRDSANGLITHLQFQDRLTQILDRTEAVLAGKLPPQAGSRPQDPGRGATAHATGSQAQPAEEAGTAAAGEIDFL